MNPAIRLGWARVDPGYATLASLGAIDTVRVAAMTPQRAARFRLGRALVARLLGELFPDGAPLPDTAPCPHCGGPHGPIRVEGAVASLAYADDLVVAAVARADAVAAVGVDVEPEPLTAQQERDLGALLGAPASTLLDRWTGIESVLKADGHGLRVDPAQVRIEGARAGIGSEPLSFGIAHPVGPDGYRLALAWREGRPFRSPQP